MIDIYRPKNPNVSVIMATYNRAGYLERSISSFINQTYKDCELIIVDDGSEDHTYEIVNNFMSAHSNIRYLKHTNRKLSLSKNAGIKAAAGTYIAFLDSDDEYKPDYLEKRVEFMKANKDIDLIEGGAIIIGDPYVKDKYDLTKRIHLSECLIGPTFFGKAEIFTSLDGFDKNIFYSEDSFFWEKAEKVIQVKKFDHPGYIYYRDTPGSICNSI
ncbi:MAG: glycosyl transferase [Sphingobacteriales bacterium UTBCD1]|jgi:glycosyltransferase involved in cell wall biosynthesis|nr:MAG: glycosyl transferase [Sphingobacteriales bacterium UTBCD1]